MASEPSIRTSHFSTSVAGQGCVFGGINYIHCKRSEFQSEVYFYDLLNKLWREVSPQGQLPPPGTPQGAYTYAGPHVYLFGGTDKDNRYHASLYKLDTTDGSFFWSLLSQPSSTGPRKKFGCGMVYHNDQLVVFGGCVIVREESKLGPRSRRYRFQKGKYEYTNELHVYALKECTGTWSSPTVSGTRPPPCHSFSLTMIDDHRAVLFGGRQVIGRSGPRWKTNDVYILDLTRMHWSKLDYPKGEPCPAKRSGHAAVCLSNSRLLVFGGLGVFTSLNDVWILDVQSRRWREVKVPRLEARYDHSATAFSLSPGLTEVVIFGGKTSIATSYETANTTVLRFECDKQTGEWQLVDVADAKAKELGTAERVKRKRELIAFHKTGKQELSGTDKGELEKSKEKRDPKGPVTIASQEPMSQATPTSTPTATGGEKKEENVKTTATSDTGQSLSVPPQYSLEVKAKAGESPTLYFRVTSDPPLAENTKHTITDKNGKDMIKFKVQDDCITFRKVDTGVYTISCRNSKGLEGKVSFELDISDTNPHDDGSPARGKTSGHTHPKPTITLQLRMRYLKLIKWRDPQGEAQRFKLVDKVSAGWREFATQIDLSNNTMDGLHGETQGKANLCWEKVMQTWLDGQGQDEYPLTWDGLFEMLEDVNCAGVVPGLKEALYGASSNR